VSSQYGQIVNEVIEVLFEQGPMTRAELCQALNKHATKLSAVIHRMRKESAEKTKRIYISGWVYDAEGKRRYPRAVYSLGNKPCVGKPPKNQKAVRRKSDVRIRALMTMNSVFNMGMTRREYTKLRKEKGLSHGTPRV
jgi:hypothetical protein